MVYNKTHDAHEEAQLSSPRTLRPCSAAHPQSPKPRLPLSTTALFALLHACSSMHALSTPPRRTPRQYGNSCPHADYCALHACYCASTASGCASSPAGGAVGPMQLRATDSNRRSISGAQCVKECVQKLYLQSNNAGESVHADADMVHFTLAA